MAAEDYIFEEGTSVNDFLIFLIDKALELSASDIHIESGEDRSLVRFRLDGLMRDMFIFDSERHRELVTRIKILANMDISERQLPQDGRMSLEGRPGIDFRVTSLPLIREEKLVIRILNSEGSRACLEKLGFSDDKYRDIKKILKRPSGMFISTGPTGSGKTTTLYALIGDLNREDKNIITIEDPVEYKIRGVNQIEVREKRGMTFDRALPAILRADPDIIMVGEIRDSKTAEIAVRSAITGHLILSTLHTYDAFSSIIRLMDMGVEGYMIASSLVGLESQRLVRLLDPDKACDYRLNDSEKAIFEEITGMSDFTGFKAPRDRDSYMGRTLISELAIVDDDLRALIKAKPDISDLRAYAKRIGFKTMLYDGLIKAKEGRVYIKDVIEVCLGVV